MSKRQKPDADGASSKLTSNDLFKLILKRHEGPGWIVLAEVGNSTGTNTQRHADAIAMGIWPSRGFSLHGYEIKVSREDVKKELRDPGKADAVGQYVDYWWLAISDLSIIDGLEIPESWGILVPKKSALRVHRQAPLRSSKLPLAPRGSANQRGAHHERGASMIDRGSRLRLEMVVRLVKEGSRLHRRPMANILASLVSAGAPLSREEVAILHAWLDGKIIVESILRS